VPRAGRRPLFIYYGAHAMKRRTPVYIVCSPRRRAGTTLLTRLLVDFLTSDDTNVAAFDTNSYEPALAVRLAGEAIAIDMATTVGQVALFDRLILGDQTAKVVDLWQRNFELFFSLMHEIGFVEEAQRQSIALIIFLLVDADRASFEILKGLQSGFSTLTFVPVFNDATTRTTQDLDTRERLRAQFRYSLRITALDPVLSLLIDGPEFSFAEFLRDYSGDGSATGQTALYSWIRGIFTQFRDLHLRLTLDDLGRTLKHRPAGKAS
jgi:hypothetical protein